MQLIGNRRMIGEVVVYLLGFFGTRSRLGGGRRSLGQAGESPNGHAHHYGKSKFQRGTTEHKWPPTVFGTHFCPISKPMSKPEVATQIIVGVEICGRGRSPHSLRTL